MRVAIIHYWFVGMRGGEKVVEALCELYPQADLFTHIFRREAVSDTIAAHKVTTSFISKLPLAHALYKRYLPLMPIALEQLDLRGYDLVISSEAGPAKGVVVPADALHICYCHSPMRYIWNMYHDYAEQAGPVTRAAMPLAAHYLRNWDAACQARVHEFVANSDCVRARIETYYGRRATVINPPVSVGAFAPVPGQELQDFYLVVGELVSYKRADIAIEACNRLGRRLVVIGGGEMLKRYRRLAGPTVTLLGSQPFASLKWHYARCKALLFPGEEDFGIVPVEAMASGRPVVAFRRGGAQETVLPNINGLLFNEQSVECMTNALLAFETSSFSSEVIVSTARRFSGQQFKMSFGAFAERKLEERRSRACSHASFLESVPRAPTLVQSLF